MIGARSRELSMLEQVVLDRRVSKAEYARRMPLLRERLYELAHAAFTHRVPVVVVFEGWAAAGKGSLINTLTERLDARGFRVVPILPPRTQESRYPWLWRFWQRIPAYGQMVIFDSSWYRRVLIDRVTKQVTSREWEQAYQDIAEFEEMLAADGTVIQKLWLHIDRAEQQRRFRKLLADDLTAWQVSPEDQEQQRHYRRYAAAVEEMLSRTDRPFAPWRIVEATHKHFARLRVFETLIAALASRLGSVDRA
jgi:polyphosphate kinase 2 (PPK2 family)